MNDVEKWRQASKAGVRNRRWSRFLRIMPTISQGSSVMEGIAAAAIRVRSVVADDHGVSSVKEELPGVGEGVE